MTVTVERALHATGLLAVFNAAGVLTLADVHIAQRVAVLGGETDENVHLAIALTVRALRMGSVCVELATARSTTAADEGVDVSTLPWPSPEAWHDACARSPVVGVPGRPLRLVNGLLYLDRYWREEELVRRQLQSRAAAPPLPVSLPALENDLDRLFESGAGKQRLAAAVCALRRVTVLAGGPGTGKTTTIARMLAVLCAQSSAPPRIALAAPTGKAAARLEEAVRSVTGLGLPPLEASTLHRLLGRRPGSRTRFKHHRAHRLPYDVVVVDETSMVSLTMTARLIEAVRPDARLILVGDPDQLASVEAGAVLGDIVAADGCPEPALAAALESLGSPADVVNGVVTLDRTWRFGGDIARLATAVRAGDADAVVSLLRSGSSQVEFVESADCPELRAEVLAALAQVASAAAAGDAPAALKALEAHRLLCAHRHGPYGVARWTNEIEQWLPADHPADLRPLLITANDYDNHLYNGDTGVVIQTPQGLRAAFARGGETVLIPPSRLSEAQPLYAMTVHRSQGSQFDRVSLVLPPATSPLLTRELFYTAVTRAQSGLRIVGSEDAVRAAVTRPIARASGLRESLGVPAV
ncbi:exodeoxyribonuclease V subunit alpha [Paractinoplanes lichenicola]|uniref:RecBCD enzyme subunit RecD n=1 Tax=Paractinoplanes lichenicola TaxID=2802976 RepID=A0ABS1VM53_9ACTN|nr:exodeoxyribonuclease V subunit alpha [Actinoplanes lichenicola]MBL7255804.1 exodeoxyribonuclease V subunit alpha [Actinoplanes lichenicola]